MSAFTLVAIYWISTWFTAAFGAAVNPLQDPILPLNQTQHAGSVISVNDAVHSYWIKLCRFFKSGKLMQIWISSVLIEFDQQNQRDQWKKTKQKTTAVFENEIYVIWLGSVVNFPTGCPNQGAFSSFNYTSFFNWFLKMDKAVISQAPLTNMD